MQWSGQQSDALAKVAAWHKSGNDQVFRIFGYAGTGKTTLAKHFAAEMSGSTAFAAYTGKAAIVMRKNGCTDAGTIHSGLYKAKINKLTGNVSFSLDKKGAFATADLIVIDECSMVDEKIGQDVLSLDVPVLVLGDPAQLPPVKGGGFFTDHEPNAMLTEIHRQAEDNPIIKLATDVREGRRPEPGTYGTSSVITKKQIDAAQILAADQVLVGKNLTRHQFNSRIRQLKERANCIPEPTDRLVCLKNNRDSNLFNGGLFTVSKVLEEDADDRLDRTIRLRIKGSDFEDAHEQTVTVRREFFEGGADQIPWHELRGTDQFDYGYALTTHKAQGSQWDNVILFDESRTFGENWQRWLYTGITRAAETIKVVI